MSKSLLVTTTRKTAILRNELIKFNNFIKMNGKVASECHIAMAIIKIKAI